MPVSKKQDNPLPTKLVDFKEVVDDFDWCEWKEMKKSTLVHIRLNAKKINEPKEITKIKLNAVRDQSPLDGNIVPFCYKKGGQKRWHAVRIKLWPKLIIKVDKNITDS